MSQIKNDGLEQYGKV